MGGGGAGGPGFVPRTVEQLESVPPAVDALVAVASGAVAAVAVSPFLMSVDRAVVAAAAGTAPGGSLFRAIAANAAEFVINPRAALANPALWMVAGVYGCTYAAANLSDVAAERNQHVDAKVRAAGKFAATTGANMTCSVFKDAAFARMYGAAVAGAAVPTVPLASYALFAVRDSLTIGGAFFVPSALSAALSSSGIAKDPDAALAASQLVSPPLMQTVCTPLHLLALDLVNRPGASSTARAAALRTSAPAALLARSLRMLPAYGVGGLLNGVLCRRGRDAALSAHHLPGRAEWDASYDGYVAAREETDDELFGDDGGEHILHQFAFALHGGLHPVALAPEVDPALYAFQWDRLIANSVSYQLADMGGDTVGGCVVLGGGDAEVDAAVDAFVRRVDSSGDGLLTVRDVEDELLRETRAGNGWAAKALRDEGGKSLDAHVVAERLVLAADANGNSMVSAAEIKDLLRRRAKGKER